MTEIAHTRTGSGPPLVLVHGVGSRREMWDPVVPALAARREVVAVDLPGFGESPSLPAGQRPPSPENLARALAGWLAEQGIERPHVAGNSLGGWVALELAAAGQAGAVTAISPGGFANPREDAFAKRSLRTSRAFARLLRPVLPALASNPVTRTLLSSQYMAKPWRIPAPAMLKNMTGFTDAADFDAAVAEVRPFGCQARISPDVPVTVAWGSRDFLLIPRQGRRAARAIPHARLVYMRGCGHVPTWDDPELVARTILETA